jgi:DNA-binding NarL/FixJ family response regulator
MGPQAQSKAQISPERQPVLDDDNAVVRMGIRSLLATTDDLEVVGEARAEQTTVRAPG